MSRCPVCNTKSNNGPFTLVPYQMEGSKTFCLGTADKNGQVCCSLHEGEYETFEDAKRGAEETSVEEVYNDNSWHDYEDQSIGEYEMYGPDRDMIY